MCWNLSKNLFLKIIFAIFIILKLCLMCQSQTLDMTHYDRMPKIYKFDNYKECLNIRNSTYCMVYAEIQPNESSSLWQQIATYSNIDKFHYHHERLYMGVCLERCKGFESVERDLDRGVLKNVITENFKSVHKRPIDQRSRLDLTAVLSNCLNHEFQKDYGLNLKIFIEYCDDPKEPIQKEQWFYITLIIIITLFILNVLSTFYDFNLKFRQGNHLNYFNQPHKNSVSKYLTTFSIPRNYNRFKRCNNSEIGRDFSFLDFYRFIAAFFVILEHLYMLVFAHLGNPEFYEKLFHDQLFVMFSHLMPALEMYFIISALMLYIKFAKDRYITEKTQFKELVKIYGRLLFSRYLRYVPSLIIFILFTANITLHLQNVPFWRHVMEVNCINCRKGWWRNLLMINNYFLNKSCWIHLWYIAADFQLYALSLILLIFTVKYPQYKKIFYLSVGISAVVIPVIVNYIYQLDSIYVMAPEQFRHGFFNEAKEFFYNYVPAYTNFGASLSGLLCGEIYMNYLKNNFRNRKNWLNWFRPTFIIIWPTIIAICYLGSQIFYEKSTIWINFYSILQRDVAIKVCGVLLILYNICQKPGFLSWPIFRYLARISFQVYLWHLTIYYIIFNSFHQPITITWSFKLTILCLTYMVSNIIGFFVTLLVEYPIAEILTIVDLKKPNVCKNH